MRHDEEGNECPATLGEYHVLCVSIAGPTSSAVKFLEDKIAESPNGRDEIVVASDEQMRQILIPMLMNDLDKPLPIRTELTVLGPDDPNARPIGFKVYERSGSPIHTKEGDPILTKEALQEGQEVLAPFFNGDIRATVKKNKEGELYAEAGNLNFILEFEGPEDLEGYPAKDLEARGWVSIGTVNTRGLERLDVKR